MATEDIIIKYKADVSELEQDLGKLVASQTQLANATKQTSDEIQKNTNKQNEAQKKRLQNLKVDVERLKQIREENKKAFDPAFLTGYNNKLNETKFRLNEVGAGATQVGNNTEKAFNQITNSLNRIAGAFGIAFSLEAIVSFTRNAVESFARAEKSVETLRDTIVTIGGESTNVFEGLNQQAETLGRTTIFSSEQIRQAQGILSAFGLTGQQIDELIPKLVGYAKITGQDIVGASQSVGNALNGTGKQFQNLGVQISTTKTELENYNAILQGTEKFLGKADLEAESINDQLLEQEKIASRLSDFVGQQLAPAWLSVKNAILQATASLLGYNEQLDDTRAIATESAPRNVDAFIKDQKELGKTDDEILKGLLDNLKKYEDALAKNEVALNRQVKNKEALNVKLREQIEAEREQAGINKIVYEENIKAIKSGIDNQKQLIKDKQDELSLDKIKAKSTKELNQYVEENGNVNRSVIKSNITLITRELEERQKAEEKARQEAEKTAQARKQLLEGLKNELNQIQRELRTAPIELIEPKSFAEAVDKIEQIRDLNKEFVDEDINLKIAQAKANNTLTKEAQELFESIRQGRKDLIDQKSAKEILTLEQTTVDELKKLKEQARRLIAEGNILEISKQTEQQGKQFENIIKDIEKGIGIAQRGEAKKNLDQRLILFKQALDEETQAKIDELNKQEEAEKDSVKGFANATQRKTNITLEFDKKRKEITDNAQKQFDEAEQQYNDAQTKLGQGVLDFVSQNAQALQQVGAILGELSNLYDVFAEKRIEQIEQIKQAEIDAIDESLAKVEEDLEFRRITDEQAKLQKQQLEDAKVKAEEEAQKKIREIKKKQAILDKANALFQIAINTAQALADVKNLTTGGILSGLILALAGLQTATVLAQPIPYRKGSKDTGSKGHMARVGEEGEEIVYMPSHSKVLPARQTKEYSEILDAMFDNNLNKYIAKTYIAPALERQKVAYENDKQSSFAENISKSIYYNGGLNAIDLERVRRKGQPITNVDEIAKAIASKLPMYDPYRR
jgi:hypothetical protein